MKHILIHGLGQKASSWNETTSYMTGQDTIICPELSLFIKDKDASYSNLYTAFSEYCNNISGPLNLCGLSLGAVLALNYAIDNPKKVNSLVLIAAQYEMPKTLLKLQNIVFKFIPETSFKSMGLSRNDFIKLTSSMMNLNFNEGLNNILCPVLLICGDKDSPNKKATRNLYESISQAEIIFIKDAKHEVNNDNPKELAEILNDFHNRFCRSF